MYSTLLQDCELYYYFSKFKTYEHKDFDVLNYVALKLWNKSVSDGLSLVIFNSVLITHNPHNIIENIISINENSSYPVCHKAELPIQSFIYIQR